MFSTKSTEGGLSLVCSRMTWKEKVIPEPRVLRVSRNSLVIETAVADQLYLNVSYRYTDIAYQMQ